MTGTSVLSNIFDQNIKLSMILNRSIIILKKSYFNLKGRTKISREELNYALDFLHSFIQNIITALQWIASHGEIEINITDKLNEMLVRKIYQLHKGDLSYFLNDLNEIKKNLINFQSLDERHIAILDEFSNLIIAETKKSYRRLMKK